MRLLAAAALALLVAPAVVAAEARPDVAPGALVVGLHLPDPGFQVGAVAGDRITYAAGLEIDLARALAARLKVGDPTFLQVSLDRIAAPGPKKWHVALARLSPSAGGAVAYSGPYLRAGPVVLARKRLRPPASLADLAATQLCTTAGSRGRSVINGRVHPTTAPLVARDDAELLGWIRTGRCDTAVREAPELAAALRARPGDAGRVVGIVDGGRSYAVAVPRATGLLPRVSQAIDVLRVTGAVHVIAMRWLGFDPNRLPVLP